MSNYEKFIETEKITTDLFRPFGDLLKLKNIPDMMINQGMCERHHDLAKVEYEKGGKPGISLFNAEPQELPYKLEMMERHPKGSQAFIPMHAQPFLVIVAIDDEGIPAQPNAFITEPHIGINFHKNIWHGVLTPIYSPGIFAVIDRIASDKNLEEHWFASPYTIL